MKSQPTCLYRDLEKEVVRYTALARAAKEADLDNVGSWIFWDTLVRGLRVTIGKRKTTFSYFKQHSVHGKRSTTCIVLGHAPTMSTKQARDAALIEAGRIAAKQLRPGKRTAVKFAEAFEDYCRHLEAKAKRRGKPPRWLRNVRQLGNSILLPEFGRWPLADLSAAPAIIRDWHTRVTRQSGPVQANRAAQVLRACYKNAAKLNRNLPAPLPTSAVIWNTESPAEKGVADFQAWAKAWKAIPSPVRRGFHLAQFLLGMRPTECSLLRWSDVDCKARVITVRNVKSGRDLQLPLSWPIVHCLRMARGADPVLIFPSARHNPTRDKLPEFGHSLRHAYASTAKAIGVDPLLLKILMGHSLGSDMTEVYLSRTMLRGPLHEAQRKISKRIVGLLGPTSS